MHYHNLPDEIKQYKQWVNWRYEANLENPNGKPKKPAYVNGYKIDVTKVEQNEFMSFDQAVAQSESFDGIGFALSSRDPYAIIDLDDAAGNPSVVEKQQAIYSSFPSYAELSPSGKGLHIIVRGDVPLGVKRNWIEFYSSQRYMTMTGNIYRGLPIVDCSSELIKLYQELKDDQRSVYQTIVEDAPQLEEDTVILNRALNAENGEKFKRLYNGHWQEDYPSNSEADLAFFNIVAFYTQNREQIVRLFLASMLGKREKVRKHKGYIPYMLGKCFDRMAPKINIDAIKHDLQEKVEEAKKPKAKKQKQEESAYCISEPEPAKLVVPPGLLNEIAECIYLSSPRPVVDIALTAAIGLMSGICGRAYNISGTGLNQYLLLLANTGVGKEACAKGIGKIMNAVSQTVHTANSFIGPAEISSSQALAKYLSKTSNSFVSVLGEFGLHMHQLCSVHAPSHMVGLRKLILDLYNKSGNKDVLRSTIYSDKDKNTSEVLSPAFSILGESSPERFYEVLSEDMIYEGFLPRFSVIEYKGKRPPLNEGHEFYVPNPQFIERMAALVAYVSGKNAQSTVQHVGMNSSATEIMRGFSVYCDHQINDASKDVKRQLWSRAHMKALKMAGIVAVGINPYFPVVDENCARWAIGLVTKDVRNFVDRFDSHMIGEGEGKQLALIVKAIKQWVTLDWSKVRKTSKAGTEQMHIDKVVPYSYLHSRVHNNVSFRSDKRGSTEAIKRCVKTLIEKGELFELQKGDAVKRYQSSSLLYSVNPAILELYSDESDNA